jgi:rRNA maturation RNase YbeY
MIKFNYETSYKLDNEVKVEKWISNTIKEEGFNKGDINYIFCDDEYLHKLNVEFLNHDTLTDIISFDYKVGKILHGDIFISIERVEENAKEYNVSFQHELQRVIIHGILHFCGYKDKTLEDTKTMRAKEDHYLNRLKTI